MSSPTTPFKKHNFNTRQRVEVSDANAIDNKALDNIGVNQWNTLSNQDCVVTGYAVSLSSGRTFDIGAGSAIRLGKTMRSIGTKQVTLDENPTSDPRFDLIEISGVNDVESDSASKVVVSALSLISVSGESLGNGDGNDILFSLANKEIEYKSLKIYLGSVADANLVEDWVIKEGSGAGGVDQVYVKSSQNGTAYLASYTYRSGGVEANQTVNTARSEEPIIASVKGTPTTGGTVNNATPAPSTTGNTRLASIEIPPNWTGGTTGVVIHYDPIRRPFLYWDSESDPATNENLNTVEVGGRIANALQMFDKVMQGFRLSYADTDQLNISPGWGVYKGVSFYLPSGSTLTVSGGSVGWRYVYIRPVIGASPTIVASTTPPTDRMEPNSADPGLFLGSFYVASISPIKIRPFYRHGNMVRYFGTYDATDKGRLFKDGPEEITIDPSAVSGGSVVDFRDALPVTGSMAYIRFGTRSSVGSSGEGSVMLRLLSWKGSTPQLAHNSSIGLDLASLIDVDSRKYIEHPYVYWQGNENPSTVTETVWARSEDRQFYIHFIRYGTDYVDVDVQSFAQVMGYIEDVRTMGASSGIEDLF